MDDEAAIPPTPQEFRPALLSGKRVRLRAITPNDYGFLSALATSPAGLVRWRHRGSTPSPEAFARALWSNVLTQFLVISQDDERPLGVNVAYNPSLANGRCYIAAQSKEDARSGEVMEGLALFVDFLFQNWNLRKLYTEALDFNIEQFRSAYGSFLTVEGVFTEWEYYDGRYCDMVTASVTRTRWQELRHLVLSEDHG